MQVSGRKLDAPQHTINNSKDADRIPEIREGDIEYTIACQMYNWVQVLTACTDLENGDTISMNGSHIICNDKWFK